MSKTNGYAFMFTNEVLGAYFPKFDLRGADVLVPTASGDHAMHAVLGGAKSVTCFDINPSAKLWAQFKIATIRALSFADFLKLYTKLSYECVKLGDIKHKTPAEQYKQIRKFLPSKAKTFWDGRVESDFDNDRFRYRHFDRRDGIEVAQATEYNAYMQKEKTYMKLKNQLAHSNIKYVEKNILDLPKESPSQYDAIFTSNIMDWFHDGTWHNFITGDFMNMLKKGGHGVAYTCLDNGCFQNEIGALRAHLADKNMKFKQHDFEPPNSDRLGTNTIIDVIKRD